MLETTKERIFAILVGGLHGAGVLTVTYLRRYSRIKTVMLATYSSTFRKQGRPYVPGVKVARPRGKLKSGVASDGPEPSPKLKRGLTMEQHSEIFIGLDPSKLKISVAVANGERNGEVRFYGDIPSDPGSVRSMVDKLATRGARLHFCYEAGPTGYDLHRQIIAMGHDCVVVAPSLIPKRPGDRVKTNRRDAVSLARLHRAGELTSVWVPDAGHEAVRDLVRAREAASDAL